MNTIDKQFIKHRKAFRTYIFYNSGFNKELADDLTQDLYIKIKDQVARGNYKEQGKFRAWALWVAKHLIVDYRRKENRAGIFVISDEVYEFIFKESKELEASIEDKIINEERFKWLLEGVNVAIEKLDPLQRKVFLMRVLENRSFKDIIKKTGEKQNTAIGRYRYAQLNIKKTLRKLKIA